MELLKQIGTEFTLVYITIIFIVFILMFIKIQKEKNNINSNINSFNYYPSLLTSLGVLGTFLGITLGLLNFDPANIDGSIKELLNGLKLAFLTSIAGMISSSLLAWKINRISDLNRQQEQKQQNLEQAFNLIAEKLTSIDNNQKEFFKNFQNLVTQQNSDNYNNVSNGLENIFSKYEKQLATDINSSITTTKNDLTTYLEEIKQRLINQTEKSKLFEHSQELIIKELEQIKISIKDFSILLSKNNTESLVNVMQKATEEFSKSMNIVIERLVKENFAQLNIAVENMLNWQKENKIEIQRLIEQYKTTSTVLCDITSNINELTENTEELVSDNGKLAQFINELDKILIEENNFTKITHMLNNNIQLLQETSINVKNHSKSCIDSIKDSSENAQVIIDKCLTEFNKTITTVELNNNNVIKNINKLNSSISEEEITIKQLILLLDSVKPDNKKFWGTVKKRLKEGLSIVRASSTELSKNLDNITEKLNNTFYEQLNSVLQNLDRCIITAIEQKNKK